MNNTTATETDSLWAERCSLTFRIQDLQADSKVWPPIQSAGWFSEQITVAKDALAHVERCLDGMEVR